MKHWNYKELDILVVGLIQFSSGIVAIALVLMVAFGPEFTESHEAGAFGITLNTQSKYVMAGMGSLSGLWYLISGMGILRIKRYGHVMFIVYYANMVLLGAIRGYGQWILVGTLLLAWSIWRRSRFSENKAVKDKYI